MHAIINVYEQLVRPHDVRACAAWKPTHNPSIVRDDDDSSIVRDDCVFAHELPLCVCVYIYIYIFV
jgi:hypothetical protein